LRIWPAPATMTACNPRGTRPTVHRFRLAAMTTIALERGGFSPWRPVVAAATPVDAAIVPMADLTEQALSWSCEGMTTLTDPVIEVTAQGL
jgi:hypothetical protein